MMERAAKYVAEDCPLRVLADPRATLSVNDLHRQEHHGSNPLSSTNHALNRSHFPEWATSGRLCAELSDAGLVSRSERLGSLPSACSMSTGWRSARCLDSDEILEPAKSTIAQRVLEPICADRFTLLL
jgi:hypothetical protein